MGFWHGDGKNKRDSKSRYEYVVILACKLNLFCFVVTACCINTKIHIPATGIMGLQVGFVLFRCYCILHIAECTLVYSSSTYVPATGITGSQHTLLPDLAVGR